MTAWRVDACVIADDPTIKHPTQPQNLSRPCYIIVNVKHRKGRTVPPQRSVSKFYQVAAYCKVPRLARTVRTNTARGIMRKDIEKCRSNKLSVQDRRERLEIQRLCLLLRPHGEGNEE